MSSKLWTRGEFRLGRVLVAVGAVLLCGSIAQAQFNLSTTQRANDGTVYQVIIVPNIPLQGGADEFRVTTVAGSAVGLQACSNTGGGSGLPTSALAGGDQGILPPQVLHPYDATVRTEIFTPNDTSVVSFNINGSGRLTIGSGGGAFDICREAANCAAGATDAPVVALTSSAGGVPAACIANGVVANCASGTRSTLGFGASLNPDASNVCGNSPTTNTTVCGPRPTDGFTLGKGQVVVFIYDSNLGMSGFTIGTGGFGVDLDNVNTANCAANQIVTSDAQNPSAPPPFIPSPTPTNTPTNTPTETPTFTPTPTFTQTNTFTPTETPTNTRPPVPLVPSPTSPAGMLMIGALAVTLLWTLRRFGVSNNS